MNFYKVAGAVNKFTSVFISKVILFRNIDRVFFIQPKDGKVSSKFILELKDGSEYSLTFKKTKDDKQSK